MASWSKTYFCIDMKCFYASVECAERGWDPFSANLVVADTSRGKNALCLAVSPHMKRLGVKNRCRLSDIPRGISYTVARPRMQRYIDTAARIYGLYLDRFSPMDIHVYSIDEAFLDATPYLSLYGDRVELARVLLREISAKVGIPATAGIGENLYLAKVALDLGAKEARDHIGILTEESYRETLWDHRPITDFWQVAGGTAARLAKYGIVTMRGVAMAPPALLHRLFGVNGELLSDHAWGRESCTLADIKSYRPKSRSVSSSQILFEDYSPKDAEVVLREMALGGCQELLRRRQVTDRIGIYVGYSRDCHPPASATVTLESMTNVFSKIGEETVKLYWRTVSSLHPIRRLGISFLRTAPEDCLGYDLFTDPQSIEREQTLERAVLSLKGRFGKNAMLRGMDLERGATGRIRNTLIGGHNGE